MSLINLQNTGIRSLAALAESFPLSDDDKKMKTSLTQEELLGLCDRLSSAEFAAHLDKVDPLAKHRASFHFPNNHSTMKKTEKTEEKGRYFCGNSLGLQHVGVEAALMQEVTKWRDQAVEGHFQQPNPWFEIDEVLTPAMAEIVGAKTSEVAIMASLTVNLHLLMAAFYKPIAGRSKILCEADPFPSDTHALVSQIRHHGFDPETDFCPVKAPEAATTTDKTNYYRGVIGSDRIIAAIEAQHEELALVMIGGVHFLTGEFFDIQAITQVAHKYNIPVGVDLAHAAGNVTLSLHDWGVDFACWCTYKYLNGGPGNIAGLFVHEKHTTTSADVPTPSTSSSSPQMQELRGWWGHSRKNRFHLGTDFDPSIGASRFQLSNPCVMGIMSLAPSVALCHEIGMHNLREKSFKLTGYLEMLLTLHLGHALEIVSPRDEQRRGCQLSVRILPNTIRSKVSQASTYENGTESEDNDAVVVQRQLQDLGIFCDNRPPDFLRLSPVPTYNCFQDVFTLFEGLQKLFISASEKKV